MKTLFLVALSVAVMCTAAGAANTAYTNTTGGTVYQMDAPSSWAIIGAPNVVLAGAGPNGADAYYRPGAAGGGDDSTQAYWNFGWANLPNVGTDLDAGKYYMQVYVSDYGGLPHEDNGVFGTANGPWGYHAMGQFSSWNGAPQSTPGWTDISAWVGGYAWLSNTGDQMDVQVAVKWNPWGGYGGLAVSGVRISKDGNFAPIPEPSSLLALVAGLPALAIFRRRH
jgi:hypothetical protein